MESNTYRTSFNQAYWPLLSGDRPTPPRSLTVRLRDLWNTLNARLSSSSEPYAWETTTFTGRTVWNAYDPISGRLLRGASPSEVRTWVEARYDFPRIR